MIGRSAPIFRHSLANPSVPVAPQLRRARGTADLAGMKRIALALLAAAALASALAPAASASLSRSAYRTANLCSAPRPGSAACLGIRLVSVSLTAAALRADATRQADEASHGVSPSVTNKTPISGGLTPQLLQGAYSLPAATFLSSQQTIAIVDAFNDPTAEADLAVYDQQFGLPACTSANGLLSQGQPGRQGQPAAEHRRRLGDRDIAGRADGARDL